MCIYERALNTFGSESQINKAMEELAELIQALARGDRDNIVEEWVDVGIVLEQMRIYFKMTDDEIVKHKIYKLDRLKKRMDIITENIVE